MTDCFDSILLRRGLRATAWTFLISLIFAFSDALEWLVLPHPFRIIIPAALVASTLLGITLLVGVLGIPKRP